MNKKPKYRTATRRKEIFEVILSSKKNNTNFIWKLIHGKRKKFPVKIVRVDENQNQIELSISITDSLNLKRGDILYLKIDVKDSAFKTIVVDRTDGKLIVGFPDEMVMSEYRNHPRYYFHLADEKIVQLRKSTADKLLNALTSDISAGGVCIYVPPLLASQFSPGGQIKLEALAGHKLETPISGEILFKMPHKFKGILAEEAGFKMGIRFECSLPQAALDRFLVREKIFSLTEDQIVRDEAFRSKVQSRINFVQKNIVSNKNFRELFKALNVEREGGQYLKQHIHLLCQVMSGLGTKLGWISDRTIEKLIYAAYLHDIRLFEHPKLARIQTKKDFERIQSTLTRAEQTAFLEAPFYAAELARQDKESYPDAVKILKEQKELPDGTGYPIGIMGSAISPLSCLFILSHFFVDYVIDHPEWTAEEFIKTYRTRLKGTYFQKIFEAMKK